MGLRETAPPMSTCLMDVGCPSATGPPGCTEISRPHMEAEPQPLRACASPQPPCILSAAPAGILVSRQAAQPSEITRCLSFLQIIAHTSPSPSLSSAPAHTAPHRSCPFLFCPTPAPLMLYVVCSSESQFNLCVPLVTGCTHPWDPSPHPLRQRGGKSRGLPFFL